MKKIIKCSIGDGISSVLSSPEFEDLFNKIEDNNEKRLLASIRLNKHPYAYLQGIIRTTELLKDDVSNEFVDAVNYIIENS